MEIKHGEHTTIVGQTGSGKTFFAKNGLLPAFNRIIIVDSEDYDFAEIRAVSVKQALELAHGNKPFVVRVIMAGTIEYDEERLKSLCEGLLEHGHDSTVYIDEVTDFSDTRTIPPYLLSLIRKSRKRRISVIVATQRPQNLNKNFLANSVHQFYFFMDEFDIEYLKHNGAPYLSEQIKFIPKRSFKSIYYDGEQTVIIRPVPKYNWKKRLK